MDVVTIVMQDSGEDFATTRARLHIVKMDVTDGLEIVILRVAMEVTGATIARRSALSIVGMDRVNRLMEHVRHVNRDIAEAGVLNVVITNTAVFVSSMLPRVSTVFMDGTVNIVTKNVPQIARNLIVTKRLENVKSVWTDFSVPTATVVA